MSVGRYVVGICVGGVGTDLGAHCGVTGMAVRVGTDALGR